MNENYLLEELKQSDERICALDGLQMSLIKFYFTATFSLSTVVLALYNFNISTDLKQLVAWFLLLPLFALGYVTNYALGKILIERPHWETTRHQISDYFIKGEVGSNYQLFGSPMSAFRTLVSWIATLALFAFIYLAVPFFESASLTRGISILIAVAITAIVSAVILASFNTARKKGQDAARRAHVAQLKLALAQYRDEHGAYPIQIKKGPTPDVLREVLPIIPMDPVQKTYYSYQSDETGLAYNLFYSLWDGGEQVAASTE